MEMPAALRRTGVNFSLATRTGIARCRCRNRPDARHRLRVPGWRSAIHDSNRAASRHERHDAGALARVSPPDQGRTARRRLVDRRPFPDHPLRTDGGSGRCRRSAASDHRGSLLPRRPAPRDRERRHLCNPGCGVPDGNRILRAHSRNTWLEQWTRLFHGRGCGRSRSTSTAPRRIRASTERRARQQTQRAPGPSIASATVPASHRFPLYRGTGEHGIPHREHPVQRQPGGGRGGIAPDSHSTTRIVPTTKSTPATSRTCPCARSCGSTASMSPTTARSFVDMTLVTRRPCRAVAEAASRPSRNVAPAASTACTPRHLNGRTARLASPPSRRSRPSFRGSAAIPAGQSWNLADINGDGRNDYLWVGGTSYRLGDDSLSG